MQKRTRSHRFVRGKPRVKSGLRVSAVSGTRSLFHFPGKSFRKTGTISPASIQSRGPCPGRAGRTGFIWFTMAPLSLLSRTRLTANNSQPRTTRNVERRGGQAGPQRRTSGSLPASRKGPVSNSPRNQQARLNPESAQSLKRAFRIGIRDWLPGDRPLVRWPAGSRSGPAGLSCLWLDTGHRKDAERPRAVRLARHHCGRVWSFRNCDEQTPRVSCDAQCG
jgi:hypothetical protein